MKALTLHQPWASLIAIGAKRIETRSWATSYRGPLAIHAAARKPKEGLVGHYHVADYGKFWGLWCVDDGYTRDRVLPLGAIVATCELVDSVPILDAWRWPTRPPQSDWIAVGGIDRRPSHLRLIRPDVDGGRVLRVYDPAFGHNEEFPLGDFTPGRFAWLLDNVRMLDEPIPAKGRQGLWEWERAA